MRAHMTGLLMVLLSTGVAAVAPDHDVAFWRAIAHDHYTPPRGSDVPALAEEELVARHAEDAVLISVWVRSSGVRGSGFWFWFGVLVLVLVLVSARRRSGRGRCSSSREYRPAT